MFGSSVFDPHSGQAKAISDLFWATLIIASLVVLLVSVLVAYSGFKYRRVKGKDNDKDADYANSEPRQIGGSLRLEIGWTAAPLVLLIILFVPTLIVMGIADPSVEARAQPDLEIIGHQWWWEYRYPKLGIVTANELHIPAGQKMLAQLKSADVDHDFWVPQLGRKMDLIPGQINQMYIQADTPDEVLHGACAEFCGAEHAWMLISVHIQTQADFNSWVQQQKQTALAVAPNEVVKGQQVFLSNTCVNCHAIAGTTAKAQIAPDLTHLGSRQMIGAGILDNTPDNLFRWIKNVQKVKPGVKMPPFEQLSDSDIHNLVTYLESLK